MEKELALLTALKSDIVFQVSCKVIAGEKEFNALDLIWQVFWL